MKAEIRHARLKARLDKRAMWFGGMMPPRISRVIGLLGWLFGC